MWNDEHDYHGYATTAEYIICCAVAVLVVGAVVGLALIIASWCGCRV